MPTLNWLTREEDIGSEKLLPFRLLEVVPKHSYGTSNTGNLIIHGDNLEALKALLPFFSGGVKCIYIDPPYNTKSAFEHYDDNLEHSQWISIMWPRLELLRGLLSEDGTLWITIGDNESHYLKVILDEVFGRRNFIANVVWQKRTSPDARIHLGDAQDSVLVYGKNAHLARNQLNELPLTKEQKSKFTNPDNDPRGPWASTDFTAQGYRPNQMYEITTPSGETYSPPEGRCWSNLEKVFETLKSQGRIWFGKDESARPRIKNYLSETSGRKSWTWWTNSEVGHNQEAKKESIALFGAKDAFDTPKPERLIERILSIASNPGDLILDSFLGSGTTAAVALKLNRQFIGIEMGTQAVTHCQPRLKKVVDGEQGGISKSIAWQGGGGFSFYRLGTEVFDEFGHIRSDVDYSVLASHIWFSETQSPLTSQDSGPFLGIHDGIAYGLLFNGVLGDRRPQGGNVLTSRTLEIIRDETTNHENNFSGPIVVYGESCRLGNKRLKNENVLFKQMPYEIKTR